MDIFLEKRVIENLTLTNYDIATYVALRNIYIPAKKEFFVTVDMIAYELFGINFPRRGTEHIKQSIFRLAEYGLLYVIKSLSKNAFIINGENLYFETYNAETKKGSFFIVVDSDEVKQIMSLNIGKTKYPLLRFFVNVIGTFSQISGVYEGISAKDSFVGYASQDSIGEKCNIDKGTVGDYFKILEQEKMLYVYRHDKISHKGGKIKVLTNHYGRYVDRKDIIQFALQYENHICPVRAADNANYNRSLMMKYRYIISDPKKYFTKYSQNEVLDIYKYISERNQRNQKLGLNDIKDLSIFEKLPCIISYHSSILGNNPTMKDTESENSTIPMPINDNVGLDYDDILSCFDDSDWED